MKLVFKLGVLNFGGGFRRFSIRRMGDKQILTEITISVSSQPVPQSGDGREQSLDEKETQLRRNTDLSLPGSFRKQNNGGGQWWLLRR